MLSKSVNGYTVAAVDRALQGLDMPLLIRVRAELLDSDLVKLYDLIGLMSDGSVSHREDQPIQGGAQVRFLETLRDTQHPAPLRSFADTILAQNRLFHLRLGETSGNFVDLTGNGRTFTTHSGITYGAGSLVPGDTANNSIILDGSSGYLSIADAAWMDVSTLFLSAWVSLTSAAAASKVIISRENFTSQSVFQFRVSTTGKLEMVLYFTDAPSTPIIYTSDVAVNDGKAHHVIGIYDGSAVLMYVDAKRVYKSVVSKTLNFSNLAIEIGRDQGGDYFPGSIDEIGMLSRVPSPKAIRDEFQAGANQRNEILTDRDRGDRIRIWYGVRMPTAGTDGSGYAEWPQITALLPTLDRQYTTTGITDVLTMQDQARALADYKLGSRITLQSGGNFLTSDTSTSKGVLAIARLAGFDTVAWSVQTTTLTASADIDFEVGSPALDAINYLLNAINYRPIRFTGFGSAVIEQQVLDINRAVVETLVADETSVISAADDTTLAIEQRKVVNQAIVFNGNPDVADVQAIVTNDKARSATSTVFLPTKPVLVQTDAPDNTTAGAIGQQIVSDETARWAQRLRVKTLPRPIHESRDKLRLVIPGLGIDADFVEDEWTLRFGPELMEHQFLSVVDVTT